MALMTAEEIELRRKAKKEQIRVEYRPKVDAINRRIAEIESLSGLPTPTYTLSPVVNDSHGSSSNPPANPTAVEPRTATHVDVDVGSAKAFSPLIEGEILPGLKSPTTNEHGRIYLTATPDKDPFVDEDPPLVLLRRHRLSLSQDDAAVEAARSPRAESAGRFQPLSMARSGIGEKRSCTMPTKASASLSTIFEPNTVFEELASTSPLALRPAKFPKFSDGVPGSPKMSAQWSPTANNRLVASFDHTSASPSQATSHRASPIQATSTHASLTPTPSAPASPSQASPSQASPSQASLARSSWKSATHPKSPYLPSSSDWKQPDWVYKYNSKARHDTGVVSQLCDFRRLIQTYEKPHISGITRINLLNNIRKDIQSLQHMHVDNVIIGRSLILIMHKEGLPKLFAASGASKYPPDVRADAEGIARKWSRMDFDPDMFRGITQNGRGIEDSFCRTKSTDWGYAGLVNGQWWPNRVALFRDGGHGTLEGGIHGDLNSKGKGAYSVVISHSSYADVDNGEVVFYCGTETKGGNVGDTDNTKLLMCNADKRDGKKHHRPVRVFRTSGLPKDNPYRPEVGIRFDGIYDVLDYETISLTSGLRRFRLWRCPGQDIIRYNGVSQRPNQEEIRLFGLEGQMRRLNRTGNRLG